MKKIQIFAAPSIQALQSEVNEWLTSNKDAHVVETNLTSLAKTVTANSDYKTEVEYAFYILYTPADQGEEESVLQASMQMPFELTDPKGIEAESN
ncbi:MAG: hypothetical protein JWQ25_2064 [Daejeonella sp.]|nr:hypothetical protein [Daejeonella sp.]